MLLQEVFSYTGESIISSLSLPRLVKCILAVHSMSLLPHCREWNMFLLHATEPIMCFGLLKITSLLCLASWCRWIYSVSKPQERMTDVITQGTKNRPSGFQLYYIWGSPPFRGGEVHVHKAAERNLLNWTHQLLPTRGIMFRSTLGSPGMQSWRGSALWFKIRSNLWMSSFSSSEPWSRPADCQNGLFTHIVKRWIPLTRRKLQVFKC